MDEIMAAAFQLRRGDRAVFALGPNAGHHSAAQAALAERSATVIAEPRALVAEVRNGRTQWHTVTVLVDGEDEPRSVCLTRFCRTVPREIVERAPSRP